MRMSTRPNSDNARAAIVSTWSFFPTSAITARALTPRPLASRTTASASAWFASVDDHVSAFPGELQHRGAAYIAPRAGDQRDFPFELTHKLPPSVYVQQSPR